MEEELTLTNTEKCTRKHGNGLEEVSLNRPGITLVSLTEERRGISTGDNCISTFSLVTITVTILLLTLLLLIAGLASDPINLNTDMGLTVPEERTDVY